MSNKNSRKQKFQKFGMIERKRESGEKDSQGKDGIGRRECAVDNIAWLCRTQKHKMAVGYCSFNFMLSAAGMAMGRVWVNPIQIRPEPDPPKTQCIRPVKGPNLTRPRGSELVDMIGPI